MANFVPVVSSKLASVKYDREQEKLIIQFGEDAYYEYQGVPGEVVLDFLFADSIGATFHSLIERGGFPYQRITPDQAWGREQ